MISKAVLGGGAIIGVIAGFWGSIKLYLTKMCSLFVIRARLDGHNPTSAMSHLLWTEFRCSRLTKKCYRGITDYVRPNRRNELVLYERLPVEQTIFWRGWKPLAVKGDSWGEGYYLDIVFLRWTFDSDDLFTEAIKKFNARGHKEEARFFVKRMTGSIGDKMDSLALLSSKGEGADMARFAGNSVSKLNSRPVGWGYDQLGLPRADNALGALALPNDAEPAIEEAKWWLGNEEWFKDHLVPWKYGLMFEGPSGTGKTATARSIGQHLDLPIFVFDVATMNNSDFVEKWGEMIEKSPCIALFEDLDNVFEGRVNIVKSGNEAVLTFDCFLNCLDGVDSTDGVFVIITTNHIDKLDAALGVNNGGDISTRPGRVDRVVHFGPLDEMGRRKIAARIFEGFEVSEWEHLVAEGDGDTGARFQARCCRLVRKLKGRR